jgi:hypothetical protein
MTNAVSPWTSAALLDLSRSDLVTVHSVQVEKSLFDIHLTRDSAWLLVWRPGQRKLAFRMAYTAAGDIEVSKTSHINGGIDIHLRSVVGSFHIQVQLNGNDGQSFRYITSLSPRTDLHIPFWPKDIVVPEWDPGKHRPGKIHVKQVGTRSGLIYFSVEQPKAGTVLYLQNLTALTDYCEQTKTSCSETVGGRWPDIGFSLPPTKDTALSARKKYIISDAIVVLDDVIPGNEFQQSRQYIDMLAKAYLLLPRPDTRQQDWPSILEKGLLDMRKPGCWTQVSGHAFLNAYVCDYKTPPEIMVQLAVLLPLLDYARWRKADFEDINIIRKGLPLFYNDKLKTVMRWLPAAEKNLEGEEEHKKPMVMDAWYLHHPLLNLSRMALNGDKIAKKLFLDSLPFAIKVARRFKYNWPVFYNMQTLEVVKAETEPGKGGEKDVAGIYAHVLLQAWELTGEKRYLREAETAARTLKGKGFDLFYQANNTAFSAGALLRLYKITKKNLYLDLSFLCLACIFKNVRLWDCSYGYGKHYPSFFALFPLSNAPYTAAYEEQEVLAAFHEYIHHAKEVDIPMSVRLLVTEYIRYMVNRAAYYYPPMLPKEMMSEEVKTGELDPNLWVAVEDLYDGWDKCGLVGQEVYGAGNAFGILPRHAFIIPGEDFMVFIDYPVTGFKTRQNTASFTVAGTNAIECVLHIVKAPKTKLRDFVVTIAGGKNVVEGKRTAEGHMRYTIPGDQKVKITWNPEAEKNK